MKKYNVCVTEISYGSVNVEAKNKQDAKDKALEAVHNGMAIFGGDCNVEIGTVDISKMKTDDVLVLIKMENNMKPTENKKVAVGYCRVSTDDQAENGLSLDVQEENCRKTAKNDGYIEIIIIRDEGKSGTLISKRKGIQEVIDLAKKREISIMYVAHSDRFARNVSEHIFLRHILRSNGVKLKYLNGQSSGSNRLLYQQSLYS